MTDELFKHGDIVLDADGQKFKITPERIDGLFSHPDGRTFETIRKGDVETWKLMHPGDNIVHDFFDYVWGDMYDTLCRRCDFPRFDLFIHFFIMNLGSFNKVVRQIHQ